MKTPMNPEFAGRVAGATAADQAIALAGILAENSITGLKLVEDGAARELAARQVDLPGVIARITRSGTIATLRCDTMSLEVEIAADALRWRTTDAATAQLFESVR